MNPTRVLRISMALPLLALVLGGGPLPAQAQDSQDARDVWSRSMLGVQNCAGALQNTGNEIPAMTDCVIDYAFSSLAAAGLQFVELHGKKQFGEHFHIERQLGFAASTGTFNADLDVVMPLTALSSTTDGVTTRAIFLQNGITRWRDGYGLQRSDMRLGIVHRFAPYGQLGDGVLGTSVFLQEDLERGHARMVTGIEYLDRWGRGSLNHYAPLTGWRDGRDGLEERALAGLELEYSTNLTNTIDLRVAGGRWESRREADAWTSRGRLDIGWRPHSWLMLRGGWDDIGTGNDALGVCAEGRFDEVRVGVSSLLYARKV